MPDDDAVSAALAAAARVEAEEGGPSPAAPTADAGLTDAADFEVTGGNQGEPERENGNGERTPARATTRPPASRSIPLPAHVARDLEHQAWLDQRVGEQRAREREAVQRRRLDDQIRVRAWRDMLLNEEATFDEIPKELREHEVYGPWFERLRGFVGTTTATATTQSAAVLDRDKLKESAKAAIKRAKDTGVRLSQFIDPLVAQLAAIAPNGTSEDDIKSVILEAAKEVNN